jgi:hypothetical protein
MDKHTKLMVIYYECVANMKGNTGVSGKHSLLSGMPRLCGLVGHAVFEPRPCLIQNKKGPWDLTHGLEQGRKPLTIQIGANPESIPLRQDAKCHSQWEFWYDMSCA